MRGGCFQLPVETCSRIVEIVLPVIGKPQEKVHSRIIRVFTQNALEKFD